MSILIRQENKDDFRAIEEVNNRAFGQGNEAILVNQLRETEAFVPELSLVAIHENIVVGHILLTKIKIIYSNQNEFDSLALAPMAVLPEYQRKGIGTQLIQAGLAKAREMNFKSVIVLGHEHYYPKFGFVPANRWNIKAPFEVPANVLMGLELIEGGLKNVCGTVQYPKEFDTV